MFVWFKAKLLHNLTHLGIGKITLIVLKKINIREESLGWNNQLKGFLQYSRMDKDPD